MIVHFTFIVKPIDSCFMSLSLPLRWVDLGLSREELFLGSVFLRHG